MSLIIIFYTCMHYLKTCLQSAWWWITYTHYENCTCCYLQKAEIVKSVLTAVVGFPTHLYFLCVFLYHFCQKNGLLKTFRNSKSKSRPSALLIFFEECGSLFLRNTPPAPPCPLHLPSSPASFSPFFDFSLCPWLPLSLLCSPCCAYLPVLISPVLLRQSTNLSFLRFTFWVMCLASISTCSLFWNIYSYFYYWIFGGGGFHYLLFHMI